MAREHDVMADRRSSWSALASVPVVAYRIIVIRSAWLCDDAYATYRTVDDFVNGYGSTWNVGERFQAHTHPLWRFLHAACYSLTREI